MVQPSLKSQILNLRNVIVLSFEWKGCCVRRKFQVEHEIVVYDYFSLIRRQTVNSVVPPSDWSPERMPIVDFELPLGPLKLVHVNEKLQSDDFMKEPLLFDDALSFANSSTGLSSGLPKREMKIQLEDETTSEDM